MPNLNKSKSNSTSRIVKTIRVSAYHQLMFNTMPGSEFPGILIRMLLDKYFAGNFPDVRKKFEAEVQRKLKERNAILANQARKNAEQKVTMENGTRG